MSGGRSCPGLYRGARSGDTAPAHAHLCRARHHAGSPLSTEQSGSPWHCCSGRTSRAACSRRRSPPTRPSGSTAVRGCHDDGGPARSVSLRADRSVRELRPRGDPLLPDRRWVVMAHAVDLDVAAPGINAAVRRPPLGSISVSRLRGSRERAGRAPRAPWPAIRRTRRPSSVARPPRVEAAVIGGRGTGANDVFVEPLGLRFVNVEGLPVGARCRPREGAGGASRKASASSELSP